MIAAMSAVLFITAQAQTIEQVVPEPAPTPSVITMPRWLRRPQPEYPILALNQGIKLGSATVRCKVEANGRLQACTVVDETPAGAGFAEAAIRAMAEATLEPVWSGHPDSKMQVTIRFALD